MMEKLAVTDLQKITFPNTINRMLNLDGEKKTILNKQM